VKELNKQSGPDIITYTSDEILLKGILPLLNKKDEYTILPLRQNLSNEKYGFVIYENSI